MNFCCFFLHDNDAEDRFCLRLQYFFYTKNKTLDTHDDAATTIWCHPFSARNLLAPEVSTLISMKRTFGAEVIFVASTSSFALRLTNKPCCNHLLQLNSFLVELLLTMIIHQTQKLLFRTMFNTEASNLETNSCHDPNFC